MTAWPKSVPRSKVSLMGGSAAALPSGGGMEVVPDWLKREIAMEKLRKMATERSTPKPPSDIERWLSACWPRMKLAKFGERHFNLWNWVDDIEPRVRPLPFVGVWPRGSGKSTTAELATVRLGAEAKRFYAWYVSGTQALADLHVESIAALIESPDFARFYPKMAERHVGKFGNIRGWRRNRLRCANGFTIDARGLDVAARGSKVEEQRPDFIILDDLDEIGDSTDITNKKIKIITSSILPAGSTDLAILAIQNLISANGVFGRMVNGTADYLSDRILDGPHKAVKDLQVELQNGRYVIVGGEATWPGQSLEICQSQINSWGLTAFLSESQHEMQNEDSLFGHIQFQHLTFNELPDFYRIICVVDPAVTSTDKSDSHGINIAGITEDGDVIHLYSWEGITSPEDSMRRAITESIKWGADTVFVEGNQGSDNWIYIYRHVAEDMGLRDDIVPAMDLIKATTSTGGKVERANQMLVNYELGKVKHLLGTHEVLETALKRFPAMKPYDLVDAAVWANNILSGGNSWLIA